MISPPTKADDYLLQDVRESWIAVRLCRLELVADQKTMWGAGDSAKSRESQSEQ